MFEVNTIIQFSARTYRLLGAGPVYYELVYSDGKVVT